MKKLFKKIFTKHLHFVILAYGLFLRFQDYNEYTDAITKKREIIPIVQNRIKQKEKRLDVLNGFLKNLKESTEQLNEVKEEIERVRQQLPGEVQDTDILDLLTNEAELINIKNAEVKPTVEKERDFYIAKEYKLEATGTYLQFMVYFERLEKKPRLIDVAEWSMQTSKSKDNRGRFQLLDVTAKIEVFKYSPDFKKQESKKIDQNNLIPKKKVKG